MNSMSDYRDANIRKLITAWGPVVVWMGVIFTVSSRSSLPSLPDAAADTLFKKGGHLTEYAILAGLCWRALRLTTRARYPGIWAFAIAVLYAASDEWHQLFVPGRNGQPLDVLLDSSGALITLAALQVWERSEESATKTSAPDTKPESLAGYASDGE